MNAALDSVLARTDVWRGSGNAWREMLPTGFDPLDACLGGGWPLGALAECLIAHPGGGEMSLFLPALARTTRHKGAAFVAPPYLPYAPALAQANIDLSRLLILQPHDTADGLWAAVRCLASGACRMVLIWAGRLGGRGLRRLQLAAEEGGALAVLFRPLSAANRPSPATLRLAVRPAPSGLIIEILKCRGRPACTLSLQNLALA